jgi:CO/xanthine dehydrogenase FAD-binding subunit
MLTCDEYVTARSLEQACAAMAANAGRYRIVAGATDTFPWAREGRAGDVHVPVLIDVAAIPELREIRIDGARARLGAATPIQRFLDEGTLRDVFPCMAQCAVWFADDQIRELATLGGNLVNASPAADATPPMIAHDAVVELASARGGGIGRRTVPLSQFVTGPGRTALGEHELVVAVECDALPGYGGSFQKVGHRRSLVISLACVAALVKLDSARRCFDDVRLAVGGIGPVPQRLADVEALLRGAPVDARTIDEAAGLPMHLVRSRTRQAYRRDVLRGFITRALTQAAQAAGADVEAISDELEASHA